VVRNAQSRQDYSGAHNVYYVKCDITDVQDAVLIRLLSLPFQQEGRLEGLREDEQKASIRIARNLLENGMDI